MKTVKDSWKKVGEDLSELGSSIKGSEFGKDVKQLGKDFGLSVAATVKHGIRAVSEWAYSEDEKEDAPACGAEVVDAEPVGEEPAEETAADTAEETAPETEETPVKHDIIYD